MTEIELNAVSFILENLFSSEQDFFGVGPYVGGVFRSGMADEGPLPVLGHVLP